MLQRMELSVTYVVFFSTLSAMATWFTVTRCDSGTPGRPSSRFGSRFSRASAIYGCSSSGSALLDRCTTPVVASNTPNA